MRLTFSILFALMIPILGVCAVSSYFSRKKIGKAVALLNISLIPPIIGNLNVIGSADLNIALNVAYSKLLRHAQEKGNKISTTNTLYMPI